MENPGEFEHNEVREEPTEASEAGERLNAATLRPEEVVEFQGNIEEAEAVEQALTEAVAAGGEERGAPSSQASMPGMEEEQGGITISPVEGGRQQSSSADEISATPITLPMEDPDGIPDAIGDALAQDSGGDEPELVIADPDGQTGDEFVGLDDSLEQTGDMRRPPNEDGGLDDMWGAEQGEAFGNLGEVDALGVEMPGQDDPGLGDPMSDGLGGPGGQGVLDGVMDFSDLGAGPDRESEMAGLMDAALAGRGGLMSDDEAGGTTGDSSGGSAGGASDDSSGGPSDSSSGGTSGGTSDDSSGGSSGGSSGSTTGDSSGGSSGSSSGGSSDDSSGDSSGEASGGGTPELPFPNPPTGTSPTQNTDLKTDTSGTMGDDDGVSPGVRSGSAFPQRGGSSTSSTGQRLRQTGIASQSYDPEGTVESVGGEPDRTLGGKVEDPVPDVSSMDELDLQESMSQPAGDEERRLRDQPPPDLQDQALSGNLDPYINWGDEQTGGGTGAVGEVADIRPIDPPEVAGGGVAGGIMDDDSENVRSADLGSEDLEDSDGLSDGVGDDPF